jgi:glucan phosphoethanolaminetransferase (alkaline phosphatase superfamily)
MRAASVWRLGLWPWIALLLLPSATTFTTALSWDADPYLISLCTLWFVAFAWVLAGPRWFFAATYPFALLAAIVLGADFLRQANLLELLLARPNWDESRAAIGPYLVPIAAAAIVLALPVWICVRSAPQAPPRPGFRRTALALLVVVGIALAALLPATFMRAWPLNFLGLGVASATGHPELLSTALPWAPINPRSPKATWSAQRAAAAPRAAETYVLVVGESVRADRLHACGNPRPVAPERDAIVYCNVMSGSSSTFTSVPLLVSREMPGSTIRVGTDATFLRAFEEAGFRTYWLSVQVESVAWPDANVSHFRQPVGSDRAILIPLLREVLREPHARKAIVLHSYDAHFPYCARYAPKDAVAAVDCARLGSLPTRETREAWLASYDNALAEGLRFLDAVYAELDTTAAGEAFVAYTPDHGENLLDDERNLFAHSLKMPTRMDTRVPAIFWANAAWRGRNPAKWQGLEAHRAVPAMHADVVPTLLGAADIRYSEPRREVVDLTRAQPPANRKRLVMKRLGEVVDGDDLR